MAIFRFIFATNTKNRLTDSDPNSTTSHMNTFVSVKNTKNSIRKTVFSKTKSMICSSKMPTSIVLYENSIDTITISKNDTVKQVN